MEEAKSRPRKLSPFKLMFITFFMVTGGPMGVESLVKNGRPFYALVGVVAMAFLYGLPEALLTCELSTMIPENGGYIIWVRRAFGPLGGWMNSWNAVTTNLFDNCVYPALFLKYLLPASSLPYAAKLAIQAGLVVLVAILNVLGVEVVAWVSGAILGILMIPFFIQFGLRWNYIQPSLWAQIPAFSDVNWSDYWSELIWLYNGWDGLGVMAGDVENPRRTYFLAVLGASVLMVVANALPIISSVTIDQDYPNWDDGTFCALASKMSQWLGMWMSIGYMMSVVGMYLATLAESSRALWAMGKDSRLGTRQLPAIFGYTYERFGTPLFGIISQSVFTLFTLPLPIEIILATDVFLNSISLLLEMAAFLYLRHKEPNAPRPFKIPGGKIVAWAIILPKILITVATMFLMDIRVVFGGILLNLIMLIAYYVARSQGYGTAPVVNPHSVNQNDDDEEDTTAFYDLIQDSVSRNHANSRSSRR